MRGLTKKRIVDKNGKHTTVWVGRKVKPKNGRLSDFLKGSKVKDVVYHGTQNKFTEFNPEGHENAWMGDFPEGAIFMTSDLDRAKLYGNKQMPLYLRMAYPLVVNLESGTPEQYADYSDELWVKYYNGAYDGIIVNGWTPKFPPKKTTMYITFEPRNIKSAVNNSGEYNPRYPNINRGATATAGKIGKHEFWHGSASGDLRGAAYGLHIGTHEAAKQALEASIGVPAKGEWDGTRKYGETLMAGQKTLREKTKKGYWITGYNCDAPEEDYYVKDKKGYRAKYSDGTKVSFDTMPDIVPVEIVGEMSNSRWSPHEDFKANGYMKAQITKGTARRGYFYTNVAEDSGSISAVVPNGSHIRVLDK